MPGALRRAPPQMGDEALFMLDGAAVASVVTIQDTLGLGRMIKGRFHLVYEGLLNAAVLEMAATYLVAWSVKRLEGEAPGAPLRPPPRALTP